MKLELRTNLIALFRAAAVFAVAAIAAGAVTGTVLLEIRSHRNVVEGGLVETTQLAVLALAGLAFAVQARRNRETPRALAMAALVVAAMAVREMDGWFDRLTGDHAFWAYLDAAVIAAFVSVPLRAFERTVAEWARFVRTPQCALFVAGVAFAVVVAQLLGYKEIWNRMFDADIWNDAAKPFLLPDGNLPGDLDLARHVKNTVEESVELASYLLILASALVPPALRPRRPAAP